MKYMVFIYPDRSVQLSPEQRAGIPASVAAWASAMDTRGVRLEGHAFEPVSSARTVQVRDGVLRVSEGPLTENAEQITGFNIFECADLDEAVEVASSHPVATFGTLEIRAFADS